MLVSGNSWQFVDSLYVHDGDHLVCVDRLFTQFTADFQVYICINADYTI